MLQWNLVNLLQITRLKCGGFFFAIRFNHTITDGQGLVQFLQAVAEFARGAPKPTTLPVWKRHLLSYRDPPRVTRAHPECDDVKPAAGTDDPAEDMNDRSFFFGPAQLSVLRNSLPVDLRRCSRYDLLAALIWRCRTAALQPDPEQEMRMCCVVGLRGRDNILLPPEYYGNAISFPAAVSTAGKLCGINPLAYAMELVSEAKSRAIKDAAEHILSSANLMPLNGCRETNFMRGGWSCYMLTDLTKLGLDGVDYGWGKALYGGVGSAMRLIQGAALSTAENKEGVKGVSFVIRLPAKVMERFHQELHKTINDKL